MLVYLCMDKNATKDAKKDFKHVYGIVSANIDNIVTVSYFGSRSLLRASLFIIS